MRPGRGRWYGHLHRPRHPILTDVGRLIFRGGFPLPDPTRAPKTPRPASTRLVDALASVKLTLVLLAVLAVASMLGTVVPQDLPAEAYIRRFGPGLYSFFYYLDLFDLYHAAWFNVLLGLLMLNLLVCSIKRLPITLRLTRKATGGNIGPEFLKKQPASGRAFLSGSLEAAVSRAREVFEAGFGRPRRVDAGWGVLLLADRGAFSRFGVYVIHASLVLIVAGAVIGNLYGFEGRMDLAEGQAGSEVRGASLVALPFAVRLDRFLVAYYPNGAPSEYRSDLTVLENGQEVDRGSVRVNHPLNYQGVAFYQQSFDTAIVGAVGLRVVRRSDGRSFEVLAQSHRPQSLPDEGGVFVVREFAHQVNGLGGPAVRVLVRTEGGREYGTWAWAKPPREASPADEPFTFELTSFRVTSTTGLMVRKDPGIPVIFTGFGLLLAGFVLTYLFSHRKLYLGLIEQEGGVLVLAGGSSHRRPAAFQTQLETLLRRIEPESPRSKETPHDPC